jgi:enoyl-CoA hydratase/carnithine racemase
MSKQYTTVNLLKKQKTAWITLDRPQKMNAINAAMLQELSEALETIEKDSNVRCVIIMGEGKKAFSAGADITELQKLTQETAAEFSRKGQNVFSQIEALAKPVVAAINGYALGGGLELALACDFRLASSNAELGFPEMKLGIIPGWGGTQRLTWTAGAAAAKRLIMLGDRVKAEEALKMGMVDKVVSQNMLKSEAEELAQRLCTWSPAALAQAKRAINSVTRNLLELGLEKETDFFAQLFSENETKKKLGSFLGQGNKKEGDL